MTISQLPSGNFLSTAFSPEQTSSRSAQLPSQQSPLNNLSQHSNSLSVSVSERFSSAENFSLSLKTREGDNVTINFSHQESYQANINSTKNQNSSSASISLETSSSSNFRFSVEGNLNEDEQKAINNLVKELSGIADKFFSGDVQDAFNSAADFKLDGSQLASIEFSLSKKQSLSSTASYESIQQLLEPAQTTRALQPLREGLQEQLNNAEKVIADANNITRSLLNELIEQDNRFSQANTQSQQRLDENLASLNSLIDNLTPQTNDNSETRQA